MLAYKTDGCGRREVEALLPAVDRDADAVVRAFGQLGGQTR
jgi:hypothetical protein